MIAMHLLEQVFSLARWCDRPCCKFL